MPEVKTLLGSEDALAQRVFALTSQQQQLIYTRTG